MKCEGQTQQSGKATLSNVSSTRLTIEAKAVDAGTPTAKSTIMQQGG